MDPNWLLDQFGTAFFWVSLRDHLRRVRAVLPVPARATPCCSRWACSSPARRSTIVPGGAAGQAGRSPSSLLTAAAFLGNVVGYEIGRKIGPPLYEHDGRILKREYFTKTHDVLREARQQGAGDRPLRAVRADLHHRRRRRHQDGPRQVLHLEPGRRRPLGRQHHAARLLPRRRAFPWLADNIDYAILGLLALSVVPLAYEWWRHQQRRRRRRRTEKSAQASA